MRYYPENIFLVPFHFFLSIHLSDFLILMKATHMSSDEARTNLDEQSQNVLLKI